MLTSVRRTPCSTSVRPPRRGHVPALEGCNQIPSRALNGSEHHSRYMFLLTGGSTSGDSVATSSNIIHKVGSQKDYGWCVLFRGSNAHPHNEVASRVQRALSCKGTPLHKSVSKRISAHPGGALIECAIVKERHALHCPPHLSIP